jgi:hypothetical protein
MLFSSSSALRKHVIVRFEAEPYVLGSARAVLARFGQGALLGAPLVGRRTIGLKKGWRVY